MRPKRPSIRGAAAGRTDARAREMVSTLEWLADAGQIEWPTAERLNQNAMAFELTADYSRARVWRRAAELLAAQERRQL